MASRLPVLEDRWKALNYPSQQAYETSMASAQQRLTAKGIDFDPVMQPHATNPTVPPIGRLPQMSSTVPSAVQPAVTPSTGITVNGMPYTPPADTTAIPSARQQAAQAQMTASPGRLAGLVPPPLTTDTARQIGDAYRSSAAANAGPINVNGYTGSQYDPAASANQALGGDVTSYAGSRYAASQPLSQALADYTSPATVRQRNVEASKTKIIDPATGRTEFDDKRDGFNKANKDQYMDETGAIKPLTPDVKASNSSAAAADAKVETAKAKAAEVRARESEKAAKTEAKGWTKALQEADRKDPAAVSSRLSAIISGKPVESLLPFQPMKPMPAAEVSPVTAAEESPVRAAPPAPRLLNILNAFKWPKI